MTYDQTLGLVSLLDLLERALSFIKSASTKLSDYSVPNGALR